MGHFQPTSASAVCSGFWLFSAWPSFPWASLNLKQRQLPIQRLTRIFCMEATMDLDLDIMGATMDTLTTTERDLLRLSLFLLPMLRLMPKLTRIFFMATMDLDIIMGAIMVTATHTTAATTMASKKGRDPIES